MTFTGICLGLLRIILFLVLWLGIAMIVRGLLDVPVMNPKSRTEATAVILVASLILAAILNVLLLS